MNPVPFRLRSARWLPSCPVAFGVSCAAFVLLCMLSGSVGCSERPVAGDGKPQSGTAVLPNVVLVTLDTTRADHLGAYGYFRETSPRFDAFAREALLFERLIVPMATTLPTHLSILTSSHPLEHGVLANTTQGGARFVPAPGLRSFAMAAREVGYATGAFVSAAPLKRGSGIEVGFERFDEPPGKQRSAEGTGAAAREWLALQPAVSEAPFFLWIHFYDAHWPHEPPEPYASRFRSDTELEKFISRLAIHPTAPRPLVGVVDEARSSANLYDAELLYQDAELGRLLDALAKRGDWPRTAVIVSGDHGEGLCQHGEAAHGGTWDEQLSAPLVIRVPGVAPGRIATALTSADILPTLLALLGEEARSTFASYLDSALGHDVTAEGYRSRPILSQDTGRARGVPYRYALTHQGFKYFRIEHPDGKIEEQLYDLGFDPHELRDVSATHTEVLADLRARTLGEIATRRERGASLRGGASTAAPSADPELLRELCALGYLEPSECAKLEDADHSPADSPSVLPSAASGTR